MSPATIEPLVTASIAAASPSKTRAVPSKTSESMPALFTTAPSGASEPRRMAMPPVACSGASSGRSTVPSSSRRSERRTSSSPSVRPVTVSASPCSSPASSSARMTTGTPPMRSTSFMTNWPKGRTSAMCGTRLPMRSKSSSVSSTRASRAMASRCRTALVEPPSAMTTAIAFSNASRVRICRAVMPCSISRTAASPLRPGVLVPPAVRRRRGRRTDERHARAPRPPTPSCWR